MQYILIVAIVLAMAYQASAQSEVRVEITNPPLEMSETATGETFNPQKTVDGATLQGSKL